MQQLLVFCKHLQGKNMKKKCQISDLWHNFNNMISYQAKTINTFSHPLVVCLQEVSTHNLMPCQEVLIQEIIRCYDSRWDIIKTNKLHCRQWRASVLRQHTKYGVVLCQHESQKQLKVYLNKKIFKENTTNEAGRHIKNA